MRRRRPAGAAGLTQAAAAAHDGTAALRLPPGPRSALYVPTSSSSDGPVRQSQVSGPPESPDKQRVVYLPLRASITEQTTVLQLSQSQSHGLQGRYPHRGRLPAPAKPLGRRDADAYAGENFPAPPPRPRRQISILHSVLCSKCSAIARRVRLWVNRYSGRLRPGAVVGQGLQAALAELSGQNRILFHPSMVILRRQARPSSMVTDVYHSLQCRQTPPDILAPLHHTDTAPVR